MTDTDVQTLLLVPTGTLLAEHIAVFDIDPEPVLLSYEKRNP